MVLLLAKNSKAGCLFRPNFLKEVVIEIQKMEHPSKIFKVLPRDAKVLCTFTLHNVKHDSEINFVWPYEIPGWQCSFKILYLRTFWLSIPFRTVSLYRNINIYILEWNTNLHWMPKDLAEIWAESRKCTLCYVSPNFHGQNCVEKLMKRYNGDIVIFELHTTHKVWNGNFPWFSLTSIFAIFLTRITTFYVKRVCSATLEAPIFLNSYDSIPTIFCLQWWVSSISIVKQRYSESEFPVTTLIFSPRE